MAFVDITKRIYSTSSTIPVIVRASIARLVSSVYPIKVVIVCDVDCVVWLVYHQYGSEVGITIKIVLDDSILA